MTDREIPPWFVAIGASGGEGLHDIQDVLGALPASLNAVVLIVLHRPWDQPTRLAEILGRAARMPVRVAADGERFRVGAAYVGKAADHLTLAASSFGRLVDDPAQDYRNRTVDLLFRSVADHGGRRAIGVVLSGSLDDGARGLAAIKAAGGLSMVLTPTLPARIGMPESAIAYDGPIDLVDGAAAIARAILDAVR